MSCSRSLQIELILTFHRALSFFGYRLRGIMARPHARYMSNVLRHLHGWLNSTWVEDMFPQEILSKNEKTNE